MTAFPLRLQQRSARDRAGLRPWLVRLAAVLALSFIFAGGTKAEEPVKGEVKVFTDGGFTRLVFRFEQEVEAKAEVSGAILIINFKKPVTIAVDRLNTEAPEYISAARRDPNGAAIRLAFARKVKVNTIAAAEQFFVDLLPENWKGLMPGLPQEVVDDLARRVREAERQLHQQRLVAKQNKPATVRVKVATQPTFVRYVFEMPETVNVVPEQSDGKLTLSFDQQIKWDLADAKAALPSTLDSIEADVDFNSVIVTFTLKGSPTVRTFREDRSIVVDIGLNGGKSKAAAVPAAEKVVPAIEAPETVPAKQAAALEQAAKTIAPQPAPKTAENPASKAAENPAPAPAIAAENPASPRAAENPAQMKAEESPAAARAPPKAAENLAPAASAATPNAPQEPAKPAESARPASNPNAPVLVAVNRSGGNLRIEFPFAVLTPAAAFRRADTLWLVFDSAAQIDLAALTADGRDLIRGATLERGADGESIVRIRLERPRLVSLDTDGPSWIVNLGESVAVPTRPLGIARSIVGKGRASIAIAFDDARKVHGLNDPEVGDRLMVVTGLGPARGFLKTQEFVELRALPSAHGVVLQPIADDIAAELSADKITISRPGGLSLSATTLGQQQLASSFRILTFDTQLWGFDREAKFIERQAELIRLAAAAPESRRKQARLNLARFYLAHDMAVEAKAVLDVELADHPGNDDVTGSVLKAVANVLLNRPEDALKDLSNPAIGNLQDAPIWRAMAFARQGKWPEAREAFKNVGAALGALPLELQRMAMREALRSAVEVRDFSDAKRVISEFETLGVPPELEPALAVLIGRLYEGLGRGVDALNNYRVAAGSLDRPAAAQGRLREIVLTYAAGDMPRNDVIHELETLTTVWRGDETEVEGLKLLAHLYTEDGRYRDAFHVMRAAMLAHPNSDLTRKIQDEAAVTFDSLFLAGKGDALPPIVALGLFYDYRELTPIGRHGDEMIRRLADRLVMVDLLDQAAELLQHQIDNRLHGAARAQVATRLAIVYLMNHKPDRAYAVLQATRSAELSNEMRAQRLLLEARAMSDLKRHDLALEVIGNIEGREAIRLRSDILWAAKRWREAAEQIELLHGERWRDFAPLSEGERSDILRSAIGYALGEEAIGLQRLREKYAAKMADGPDWRAFDVVSAPIGTGSKEFQDIARRVASVNTLDTFLRDMRARYPDAAPLPGGDKDAVTPAVPAIPERPKSAKTTMIVR